MDTFRFPSKTFLLGEYAILQGSNALLFGHPPFFTATHEYSQQPDSQFHPESPAGLWIKQNPFDLKIRLQDPHEGRGGYGASGAEFLAAWTPEKTVPLPEHPRAIFAWSAWEDSRPLPGSGSGADILTQAFGVNRAEPFFLEIDPVGRTLREIYARKHVGSLSLFHTGKKLETRAAAVPASLPVEELEDMVLRACSYLESGLFDGFAKEVNAYGEKMASLGLVAPHTTAALSTVREIEGVKAAKGCGAMGADVILVVHAAGSDLAEWAEANSLALTGEFPI
jgi:hypothetical protein